MNQQTIVSLLILCPVITIFLPTAPLIVLPATYQIVLSVIPFLSWAILGMIFKVVSTSMGYILIVKGAHRLFLGTELFSWSTILITNIIGYTVWGIEGIGIAFLFSYVCYLTVVGISCRKIFKVVFNREVLYLFLFTSTLAIASFISVRYLVPVNPWYGYAICVLLITFSLWIAIKRLWQHIK